MRTKLFSVVAGAALLVSAAAVPVIAHHSFAAEFDAKKPVKLRGTVVKMEWINPHSWIHIDVKNADGKVERWMVEGGAPNALLRRGWNKNSLPDGHRDPRRGLPGQGRRESAPTAVTSPSRTARSCSSARRASARRTNVPTSRSRRRAPGRQDSPPQFRPKSHAERCGTWVFHVRSRHDRARTRSKPSPPRAGASPSRSPSR